MTSTDTDQPAQPATYDIETLLNSGAQPLPDLEEDELDALSRAIGKGGPLPVPIDIGEDGTLIDGHQRLKAMAKAGRKRINANDVRIMRGVTRANAWEWAVTLNVQRRHLSTD